MPRFKMLKSIANNIAHGYLSLTNYIDGGYTVVRLFEIAKESKQTEIEIDVLNQSIKPEIYSIPQIKKSLNYLEKTFVRLISAEDIGIDQIVSVIIKIDFDLSKTQFSQSVQGLELPKYDCLSEIKHINGKTYSKEVEEWWKY